MIVVCDHITLIKMTCGDRNVNVLTDDSLRLIYIQHNTVTSSHAWQVTNEEACVAHVDSNYDAV
jgi:hypothetical protein